MRRLSTRSEHDFLMDEEEEYRRFLDEKDRRRQAIADKEDMFGPDGLSIEEREILEGRTCGNCKYSAWSLLSLYCYNFRCPGPVKADEGACGWFARRG